MLTYVNIVFNINLYGDYKMQLSIQQITEDDGTIRYWIFKTENGHTYKINDISVSQFQSIKSVLDPLLDD